MQQHLLPLSLVIIIGLTIPRYWLSGPKVKKWSIWLLLTGLALLFIHYAKWRVLHTMPDPGTNISELVFYWSLLGIEVAAWIDTAILFAFLARPRSNSVLADTAEKKLRALNESDLPAVDVFIATYNEDFEVLEKTIVGVMAMEWPEDKKTIYLLDDGKREWLKEYCEQNDLVYFTRDGNEDAKAGNINAAIARTTNEYFMVLDADFIPQQSFLYRAMGLFSDPKVGIVQIPHNFYNADPMQNNLGLRKTMPDDQRFFFDTIMTGRDGWDTAFCCGSNSITRRSAINSIGGKLPSGSITEDMLLTLAMFRTGYITRYLNERLAVGLAAESLTALYVQRARWARGAMQIMFLKNGPLGPKLRLHERIMFIPLHWLVQPLMAIASLITPTICLWTGWSPLPRAQMSDVLYYQVPILVATVVALRLLAPKTFFPLSAIVYTILQSTRIIPTILSTLIKPHGHAFEVTPKGSAAGGTAVDKIMIFLPALVILSTAAGLYVNSDINTRIILDQDKIPLLAMWSIFSMIVLSVVQAVAISRPAEHQEEIFDIDEYCTITVGPNKALTGIIKKLSLDTAVIELSQDENFPSKADWVLLNIADLGAMQAYISYAEGDELTLKITDMNSDTRKSAIEKLFTKGLSNTIETERSIFIIFSMIWKSFQSTDDVKVYEKPKENPPAWVRIN